MFGCVTAVCMPMVASVLMREVWFLANVSALAAHALTQGEEGGGEEEGNGREILSFRG